MHRTGIRGGHGFESCQGFESRCGPEFFRLLLSDCLNWKFTVIITPHFHLQTHFKYELFHIYFTLFLFSRIVIFMIKTLCRPVRSVIITCPHATTFTLLSIFPPLELSSIKPRV